MTIVDRPITEQRTGPGRRTADRERVTPMGVDIAVTACLEPLLYHRDPDVQDAAYAALRELRKLNS